MAEDFDIQEVQGFDLEDPTSPALTADATISASYAAALNGNEDVVTDYRNIKTALMEDRNHPLMNQIKDIIAIEDQDAFKQSALTALEDETMSETERTNILQGYLITKNQRTDLQTAYLRETVVADNAETIEEADVQEANVDAFNQVLNYRYERQKIANGLVATFDASTGAAITDFFLMVQPFVEGANMYKIAEELDIESDLTANVMLYGSLKKKIRNAMEKMPPEQRVEATRHLVSAIKSHAGPLMNDNDFAKFYYLQDLVEQGGLPDWQVGIDNVVGVLDAIGLGVLARYAGRAVGFLKKSPNYTGRERRWRDSETSGKPSGPQDPTQPSGEGVPFIPAPERPSLTPGKLPEPSPNSPIGATQATNSRKSGEMAAVALTDETGETAFAFGTSREEIISGMVYPKPNGSDITGAPENIVSRMEEFDVIHKEVMDQTAGLGLLYSDAEKAAARSRAWEQVQKVQGMKVHLSKTQGAYDGEAFRFDVTYGANDVTGFKSIESAQAMAKEGLSPEGVTFLERDPVTNKLEVVEDPASRVGVDGDYYIRQSTVRAYDPLAATTFGPDAVSGVSGRASKYTSDPSSRFNEVVRLGAMRAIDVQSNIEKKIIRNMNKDLLRLVNPSSKAKIFEVIEEGIRLEKNFSYEDLVTKFGMNNNEAMGYFSFRRGQDLLWSLVNEDAYLTLRRGEMQSVYLNDEMSHYFAKPLAEDTAKELIKDTRFRFMDVADNSSVKMNKEEIKSLYARGGSISKFNSAVHEGTRKFGYSVVDPAKGAKLGPLNRSPVPYREGYVARFYKEHYFVEVRHLQGSENGIPKVTTEVVAAAGTRGKADIIKQRIEANSDLSKIEVVARPGREFMAGRSAEDIDFEFMKLQGLGASRRRGEHLKGDFDGVARREDVIESTLRATRAVTKKASHRDWVESSWRRFSNDYPELLSEGKVPQNIKSLEEKIKASGVSTKDGRDAVALYEYIKMMEQVPEPIDVAYRNFILWGSERLESIAGGKVSETILKASNFRPLGAIRGTAFFAYLATNPLRQLLVQGGQVMQLAPLDFKYVATGGVARDSGAIANGMMFFTKGRVQKDIAKVNAKLMGISVDEYQDLVKAFRDDSGLPYSIDRHSFVEGIAAASRESFMMTKPGQAAQLVIQSAKAPFKLAKVAGFDAGEFINILGTWLVARRRWLKANPDKADLWKKKENMDRIVADARELSWAMTRAGRGGSQGYPTSGISGALSVPLQFFAVGHKAMLVMAGRNKAYTRAEKLRMLPFNLAIFGASGVAGLNLILDKAKEEAKIDIPDEVWTALKGGMMDVGLNTLIKHLIDEEGEETQINFAENFAPGGAGFGPLAETFEAMFADPAVNVWLGPSSSLIGSKGKIWNVPEQVGAILKSPILDTPEKVQLAFKAIAQISSGMSNYYKFKAALNTGKLTTKGGKEIQVTRAETLATIFGFKSAKESDYYTTIRSVLEDEKDVREDAKVLYNNLINIYRMSGTSPNDLQKLVEFQAHVFTVYDDPWERDVILDEMQKQMSRNRADGNETLMDLIVTQAMQGKTPAERMNNLVQGNSLLSDSQKIELERFVKTVFGIGKE